MQQFKMRVAEHTTREYDTVITAATIEAAEDILEDMYNEKRAEWFEGKPGVRVAEIYEIDENGDAVAPD